MPYWGVCKACGLVRYSATREALARCPACGGELRVSEEMPRAREPRAPREPGKPGKPRKRGRLGWIRPRRG